MSMPAELSMPVQRVLRTMISGIMLVQCFTVYVYLASYIVLLYPVFLEERPTLVLPWLLLAAIRKLLCELTSLAMGLGTCVLLGPAKPPCIKFLVAKIATIMPAFYIWILFYSYYHALKMATAYKTFPIVLPPSGLDYGLELAVRRRCTKSLFGEEQLRKKLQAGFYADKPPSINITPRVKLNEAESTNASSSDIFSEDAAQDKDVLRPLSTIPKLADIGAYEDWFGSEIMVPRGDRILEQFVVMLLRIAAYMKNDGIESINSQMFNSALTATWATRENIEAMPTDVTDTPPLVGNSKGHTASYLRNYPQIFMKKLNTEAPQTERKMSQTKNTESTMIKGRFRTLSRISTKSYNSNETTSLESKRFVSDTIIDISSKKSSNEILKPKLNEKHSDKLIVPKKKQSHHEKSYDERVVEDVKKIIEETYDRYLVQSLNYSNLAYEKLRTEHQPEIKLMSGTNLATDEFLLTTIEEMIQSCSRHIAHNNDMSVKSRLSEQINDKVVTSSLNLDGKNLEVNSSDHTKETTDTIENLVQIKTENIKYEESKSPKGVDSEYVEIELVDSNNVTCIESTGTTNDIPEPFCIQELEPEKEQDKEPGVCINTDTAEVFTDVNLDNVTNDTENKDSIVTNSISIQPEIEGIGHDEKIVCSENVDLEAFVGTTSEETKESVNNNAETEEILNSPSNSQEINSLENTSKLPDETRK